MDARILSASGAERHRPPAHPEGRRVTSLPRGPLHGPKGHESPVMSCKLFRFTLLSKNASANHLESHSCKNKGLKVPCFHTLTKKGVGEGALGDGCHPDRAFRPSAPTGSEWRDLSAPLSSRITDPGSRILRASSGISPRFSSHESPVTNHNTLPLNP